MKINQVEELVGITKKNIRFYEDQGLLNPNRNPENGYREYDLRDVDRLMKIKLLRKLNVPIEEIRQLQGGGLSFGECMEKQAGRLSREQKNLELTAQLCSRLSAEVNGLDALNVTEYLDVMARMEKEGTKFMDITKEDIIKKKKRGSWLSAAVMIVMFTMLIALMYWANTQEPLPTAIFIFLVVFFAAPIVGIIIALRQRIKEINGGEEDEARKY